MRCFVAVDVPADVRAAVGRVEAALRAAARTADVRWVDPAQLHVTLKFLGAAAAERLPALLGALETVARGAGALRLEARGVGGFPSPRRPRVVWVGVAGEVAALGALAAAVERAVEPLGFPPEGRPFRAHLTLGRVRSPRGLGRLARAIEGAGQPEFGAWTASELVLYQSHLRPTGAVYEAMARLPLGGSP
jgi:2'-5' RNA ligase